MCAPIPIYKWSWRFDKCIKCGTTSKTGKYQHKGRGMCLSCWDKDRDKKPRRQEVKMKAHDRWYARVKGTPEFIKYTNERAKEYRDTSSAYQGYLWKRYMLIRIDRFLKGKRKYRHRLKIVCECCNEEVDTPFRPNEIEDEMEALILFRKEVIKRHKKFTHS